jgi:hypothetical protein
MKTPLKIAKTNAIKIGDRLVEIKNLPKELIHEIETCDQMKQDMVNASYEVEKCTLAYQMKLQQVLQSIAKHLNLVTPGENDEPANPKTP